MIIAITGSFGTGKSSVSEMFGKHGFVVMNVDKLYEGLFKTDKALQKAIEKKFGTLNRNKIKSVVFNDSEKLKELNKITHPLILGELRKKVMELASESDKKKKLKEIAKDLKIAVDIPLLFEAKYEKHFDKIVVVKCRRKTQLERIQNKEKKYSKKEAEQIIKSQMPLRMKIKRANFVVDNDKDLKEVEAEVEKIVGNLLL